MGCAHGVYWFPDTKITSPTLLDRVSFWCYNIDMKQKKVYVLVGVPGSGKSTWIKAQIWALGLSIVSTDMWVEMEAERVGKTYSEIFADYMPHAVKLMVNHVELARDKNMDIIWDQTSTTVTSRKRKFNMLPDYYHIAVVFETPSRIELKKRLASRPGKEIPDVVIEGMLASFEMPTEEEGYKEIWRV
jgi:predicted kinase